MRRLVFIGIHIYHEVEREEVAPSGKKILELRLIQQSFRVALVEGGCPSRWSKKCPEKLPLFGKCGIDGPGRVSA